LIALCNAAYALTLPHTPPAQLGRGPLEAVRSLGMLRQRVLLTLVVVATAAGAMMQSNMILQGLYFTSPSGRGLSVSAATKASTVSQMLELALFPLLGPILRRFKLRTLLLIGVGAWPLRFLANALGEPTALVVGTQLLHGFNVVFGIFAVQMAANRLAPAGRRASTQGLLTTGSAGVGALSGQLGCGVLLAAFTSSAGTDWRSIYAAPLVLGALATVVLFFGFRPQAVRPEAAA
jgi:MFS family permease